VIRLTIDILKDLCNNKDNIYMTYHVAKRCEKRGITGKDIVNAILNGEIIEDYPEDFPYPSALVFGHSVANKILHVVAGVGDGMLWIITSYYPNNEKWEDDFKTRKVAKENE
jgi:hypothetical protein